MGRDGRATQVPHLLQGAGLDDSALADDAQAVGKGLGLAQDVAAQQHAAPPPRHSRMRVRNMDSPGVQAGGRLVEQRSSSTSEAGDEGHFLLVALE